MLNQYLLILFLFARFLLKTQPDAIFYSFSGNSIAIFSEDSTGSRIPGAGLVSSMGQQGWASVSIPSKLPMRGFSLRRLSYIHKPATSQESGGSVGTFQ